MNNIEPTKQSNISTIQNTGTPILSSDVVLPRLLLCQGLSDAVKQRKAQSGDIIRSTDAYKLGSPDKMTEIIPLSVPKTTWVYERKLEGQNRYSFYKITSRTPINENLPWQFFAGMDEREMKEGQAGAIPYRRVKCMSLYVLAPQDIDDFIVEQKKAENGEFPDLSKALTPMLVTFRSTSYSAGKEISTFYTQAAMFRTNPSYYKLKLGCYLDSKGSDDFYVFKVDRSKPEKIKDEHKPFVDYWSALVSAGNVKIDDSAEEVEPAINAMAQTANTEDVPF